MPRAVSWTAATGEPVEEARAVNPGGGSIDGVAVGHPAGLLAGQAGQQDARLGDGQLGAAELADLGLLDAPAERVDQQLHAVTDPHHGDPELEQPQVQRGSPFGVDRGGATREDDPAGFAPGDLLDRDVVGKQLAEDAAVANAPGDQLRVLPAVVEHDDLLCPPRRRA